MSDKEGSIVVKMFFGSKLYGTDTVKSDTDYKGIILPTKKQILLQTASFHLDKSTGNNNSKNSETDIDDTFYSLQYFINLASKGETVALDMLHAPVNKILINSDIWRFLSDNKEMFYTKRMKSYIGYVTKQAAKYGIKGSKLNSMSDFLDITKSYEGLTNETRLKDIWDLLPIDKHRKFITVKPGEDRNNTEKDLCYYEICGSKYEKSNLVHYARSSVLNIYNRYGERAKKAAENNGIDWKALHHSFRAAYQAKSIFIHGGFSYPLEETEFLMKVKRGELDYTTEIEPVLTSLVQEVNILSDKSSLPEKVDMEFMNSFIIKTHLDIVNN